MSEKKMSLRETIEPKSDQLNYDDLIAGPLTVRVIGLAQGNAEQPVIVRIANADTGAEMRPFKPCKSMRRVLVAAWGDKGKDWIGKYMTLYGDATVKWGGVEVGGIRISHVSGIDAPLALKLTTTRGKRAETVIKPLSQTAETDNTDGDEALPL
jgi:tryptophan synthase beta subunit